MREIITKLYLYDSAQESNNYRGKDYSDYILQGDSDVDDLTEILDVVNLTLVDLPFYQEFEPKTKFILEKWEKEDNSNEMLWKDWHLCVARDIVSQPILSDDTRFDHAITLNEASVDAQGRLVDNIAVTYRLKDVSLESKPTYDTNAKAITRFVNVEWTPNKSFGSETGFIYENLTLGHNFRWIFPNWYNVTINGITNSPAFFGWNYNLNQEIPSGQSSKVITIPTPMLECLSGIENSQEYKLNGYCSIDIAVEELNIAAGKKNFISINNRSAGFIQVNPAGNEKWTNDDIRNMLNYGWIVSRPMPYMAVDNPFHTNQPGFNFNYTKVAILDKERRDRTLSFTINVGCQYNIIVRRHIFSRPKSFIEVGSPDLSYVGAGSWYDEHPAYHGYGWWKSYMFWSKVGTEGTSFINASWPSAQMTFNAVLQGQNINLYLRNAPIETAYKLYNKALLTTQNFNKQAGTPIDETPKPYYLEDKDKQELANTIVVENFYNQKNWWELQLDIGKYIHAIPKVRFGSNDRFVTTWKKLGSINQKEDNGNTLSIYNSKNVEEYISSLSSYVSNMVQLGGIIDEWVSAKSTGANHLVYNDVAQIITSRNIIELVDMEVKNISCSYIGVGEVRNLVGKGSRGEDPNGYVFSQDVYNIFSVNANDSVNKGMSIYYTLGGNKIEGLTYRLPSVNAGETVTEYAIKRIIGTVFGISVNNWKNIRVNDFLFHIVYRTKDTLRVNQIRPDLRKYLLTSKHDRVPQHNQFNNQTDTVVDSVKFGNNIYGNLIRTGNTIYTKTEWVDSLFNLKQAGELYHIRDNMYYVAKVKNTYYSDHIISEVEFSKDFNRLSQIIGIPSEPRFYEISEQSHINRQVTLDDYIVVGTSNEPHSNNQSYVRNNGWGYITGLMFGTETAYPKYVVTAFKNDIEKETITGNETFCVQVCHFLAGYSVQNTLTLSWGMADNFSAGDRKENTELSVGSNAINGVYAKLLPYRYTDVYGRADLLDFAIIRDFDMANSKVLDLPSNPIVLADNEPVYLFGNENIADFGDNMHGIGLLKDNREVLSFNYNLQVLTDSDRFVLSAYMWQLGKANLKLALLSDEVNKISNDTIPNTIIASVHDFTATVDNNGITVNIFEALSNVNISNVKAMAIISTNEINDYIDSGAKYFIMARNVTGLVDENKRQNWYVNTFDKSKFHHQ